MRTTIALFLMCGVAWCADWPTDGYNAKRTNWQPDEKILNKDNVKNLKILWKLKLDVVPHEMHALFPPLIIDHAETSSRAEASRHRIRH